MRLLVLCAVVTGCHHDPLTPTPYDAAPRPDSPAIDAAPLHCTNDSDCAATSNVCLESTATCVPEAAAIYVTDAMSGGDDANACTRTAPCASISRAIALVDGTRTTIALDFKTFAEPTTIASMGKAFTLSGPSAIPGNSTIAYAGTTPHPLLTITGTADVFIEGVEFTGAAAEQAAIDQIPTDINTHTSGVLKIERSLISGLGDVGIKGNDVQLTRAEISDRTTGVVVYKLTAQQFFAHDNGNDVAVAGPSTITNAILTSPIAITSGSLAQLVVNFTTFGTTTMALKGSGADVTVENSIFAKAGQTYPAGVTINYSLAVDTAPAGTGNRTGVPLFLAPGSNLAAGYKIQPGSAAIDHADPASQVTIDYFGNLRPPANEDPHLTCCSDIGAAED